MHSTVAAVLELGSTLMPAGARAGKAGGAAASHTVVMSCKCRRRSGCEGHKRHRVPVKSKII